MGLFYPFTRTIELQAGEHDLLIKHNIYTGSKKIYIDGKHHTTTKWALVEMEKEITLSAEGFVIVLRVKPTGMNSFEYSAISSSGRLNSCVV